eukprot:2360797-Amphidinium_carterae.1
MVNRCKGLTGDHILQKNANGKQVIAQLLQREIILILRATIALAKKQSNPMHSRSTAKPCKSRHFENDNIKK